MEHESNMERRKAILENLEKEQMFSTVKKHNFPEYLYKQMADLEEFSDESLHVYPEVIYAGDMTIKEKEELILNQMSLVLEFLSQPQSLQWYSRRCLRENMVSLQPSVVKTLPLPSKMKRYILCHEI